MRKELVAIFILSGAAFVGFMLSGPIADPRSPAQPTLTIDDTRQLQTTPAKQSEPAPLTEFSTKTSGADASSDEALIRLVTRLKR